MTAVTRSVSPAQKTVLTSPERSTLEAICNAFVPALAAEIGDDPALFALDAATIGVAAAIEQAIGGLDEAQRSQFRRLLRVLEQPWVIRLLIGKGQGFRALGQDEQARALLALATSRLPLLRTGFQGLKRLATFLFYSLTDAHGHNPTWPAIGYAPPANTAPAPRRLSLTAIDQSTTIACDVCVIGSGAGGSVVAAELAAAGKDVVVLEAGGGQQAPDFVQREISGMRDLYLDGGLTSSRDLGVAILAGAALGGGTTVNWQTSLRLPDAIRDEWAALSGCTHFADAGFTRSFEMVEARLNVNTDESVINGNNAALRDGCDALGYRWATLPRNARQCDPAQCGYCVYGCRHGGKQSTAVTYLLDAQRTGAARIVAHCRAERVLIANGRVVGVHATATDAARGAQHMLRINAPTVVVAAGAIESPALLLRSGVRLPALGRNLFLHPVSAVSGTYPHTIAPWDGPPQSILSDQFASLSGLYGFRLETAPAHPGLLALATPWFSARQHRREMQQAARKSAIIALVRDQRGGRVRISRDGRPIIEYQPGRQERAYLQQGVAAAARVHLAAGASDVLTLHVRPPAGQGVGERSAAAIDAYCNALARQAVDRNWATMFSAHQMGTCRMGSDPRQAVCDGQGQVFGLHGLFIADSSAFPASSGVNPMLTIMALAHHTAQRIKLLI